VNELDQGRDDDELTYELQDVNIDSIQHSGSGEAVEGGSQAPSGGSSL
jgi:hypothetical protein